jgi:hypothetical protein
MYTEGMSDETGGEEGNGDAGRTGGTGYGAGTGCGDLRLLTALVHSVRRAGSGGNSIFSLSRVVKRVPREATDSAWTSR